MGTGFLVILAIICAFLAFRFYRQGHRIFKFWVSLSLVLLVLAALLALPSNQMEAIQGAKDKPLDEVATYNGLAVQAGPYEIYQKNGNEVAYTVQNRGGDKVQMYVNDAYAFVEGGKSETILYDVKKKTEEVEFKILPENDSNIHVRYTIKQTNEDA